MTKQKILNVATDEFAKYGYDKLSMNNLAKKLDVNKATIYYHFKDKQSLYQEILTNLIHLKSKETEEIINNSNLTPKERFKAYIDLFIQAIQEQPQIVPLSLREMANLGVNINQNISKDFEEEMLFLKEIVEALDLKEKYKNIDFYDIKALIMGTINTYYSMQMSKLEIEGMKDFNQDSKEVLNYLGEFISNILLDALCKE